jgi:FAD/FMN-containing dehydrogenase/biotin carboxylase
MRGIAFEGGRRAIEGRTNSRRVRVQGMDQLKRQLTGPLFSSADPGYEEASRCFYPGFPERPRAVAECQDERDVALCLRHVRDTGIAFAIRAGGHSPAGFSGSAGLVIDVSALDEVWVARQACTAWVGAGVRLGALARALDAHGLHVPTGSCAQVAVGGFMQGGGYGYTSRRFGMNCDSVIAIRMMLADGRVVLADRLRHADLFWAVRGGIGGNFGVLLAVQYALHELPSVWAFALAWDIEHAPPILLECQRRLMQGTAASAFGFMLTLCKRGGRPRLLLQGLHAGDRAEGLAVLRGVPGCASADLLVDQAGPYADMLALLEEAPHAVPDFTAGRNVQQHPPQHPHQHDHAQLKEGGYVDRFVDLAAWHRVVGQFIDDPEPRNTAVIEPYGGRIRTTAVHDCAFMHRAVDFHFHCNSSFSPSPAAAQRADRWARRVFAPLQPFANGHRYQNYPRRGLPDHAWQYWGGHLPALVRVKQRYDPEGLFRFEQGVPAHLPAHLPAASGPAGRAVPPESWVAGVDLYSSGSLYRSLLQECGYKVVHVQSSAAIPAPLAASFEPALFDALLLLDPQNPAPVLEALASLGVRAIVTGCESGVAAADLLARELGLPGNDPGTSTQRVDKVAMHGALRHADVPGYPQALVGCAMLALQWMAGHGIHFPVVTKPRGSAGSQFLRLSRDAAELERHLRQIIGRTDMFGQRVDEVLLEDYLTGPEFAVNGVVHAGQAHVTDVWECHKRVTPAGAIIHDRDVLLDTACAEVQRLLPCVHQALAALGFEHGCFHAELKLQHDGPRLLEVAARPMGSMQPRVVEWCTGTSQVRLHVEACLDPAAFERATQQPCTLVRHGQVVDLACHDTGVVQALPLEALLRPDRLPSYAGHRLNVRIGQQVRPTEDRLCTHLGTVFLAHHDLQQLERDYQAIRQLERHGGLCVTALPD